MGLDMFMIRQRSGIDYGGRVLGYWRKAYDLNYYFISHFKPVKYDDGRFEVKKEDLKKIEKDLVKIIDYISNSLITPEKKYEYYKEIINIKHYDDTYSNQLNIKVNEILHELLYTLGTISFILQRTDFRSYKLFYDIS